MCMCQCLAAKILKRQNFIEFIECRLVGFKIIYSYILVKVISMQFLGLVRQYKL